MYVLNPLDAMGLLKKAEIDIIKYLRLVLKPPYKFFCTYGGCGHVYVSVAG